MECQWRTVCATIKHDLLVKERLTLKCCIVRVDQFSKNDVKVAIINIFKFLDHMATCTVYRQLFIVKKKKKLR